MAALSFSVYEDGLNYIDTVVDKLYILTADPGLVWANIATYGVGDKTSPAISAPTVRGAGGAEVTISAITDGSAYETGSATHWALVSVSESEIIASGELSAPLSVTDGGTFGLTAFTIGIPGVSS